MPSCLRLMPGLEDEVMARAPVAGRADDHVDGRRLALGLYEDAAPALRMWSAMYSPSSFCGVMG